jgi:hypothetical protein
VNAATGQVEFPPWSPLDQRGSFLAWLPEQRRLGLRIGVRRPVQPAELAMPAGWFRAEAGWPTQTPPGTSSPEEMQGPTLIGAWRPPGQGDHIPAHSLSRQALEWILRRRGMWRLPIPKGLKKESHGQPPWNHPLLSLLMKRGGALE